MTDTEVGVQTQLFLNALFGSLPEGYFFLIWHLKVRSSEWHRTVENIGMEPDTFVGMSVTTEPQGFRRRLANDEVGGIVGLWADIDVSKPDSGKRYCTSRSAARDLINSFPLEPTMIVDSGHGYHTYWLFKELWIFESDEERAEAALLSRRWQATLQEYARRRERDLDMVSDLSRIMRLPGTLNTKWNKLAQIVDLDNERRYDPSAFEGYLVDVPFHEDDELEEPNFSIDWQAEPPEPEWGLAQQTDHLLTYTYNYDRKDFAGKSASEYDMALADRVAVFGWSDQQIVDLLVSFRARHGLPDKTDRPDYYAMTLRKAREKARGSVALNNVVGGRVAGIDALKDLSTVLGVRIVGMIRYDITPGQYRMETGAGSIPLGDVTGLTSWRKFHDCVFDKTGVTIKKYKDERWRNIIGTLWNACETVSLGDENTERGQMREWVEGYLEDNVPEADMLASRIRRRRPFIYRESTHLFLSSLREWVFIQRGVRVTNIQLRSGLRMVGWSDGRVKFAMEDGTQVTRSIWRREVE